MHYVYFLKSIGHKRYYIDCTTDYNKRLVQHNAGKTKSTRPYKPWKLIYSESYENKSEAYKREWYLKHPEGYLAKLVIMKNYGEVA